MVTAAKNPDHAIAVVIFNEEESPKDYRIILGEEIVNLHIDGQALQTILIPNQ